MKTIVKAFAEETRTVVEQGKRVKRSNVDLLIKALVARTLEGDVTAIKYLEVLRTKLAPDDVHFGFLAVPETLSEDEWARHVEIHNSNVVQPDPMEDMR